MDIESQPEEAPPPPPPVVPSAAGAHRLQRAMRDVVLEHFACLALTWIILLIGLGLTSFILLIMALVVFAKGYEEEKDDGCSSLSLVLWLNIAYIVYNNSLHILIVKKLGYDPRTHDLDEPIPEAVARWGLFVQCVSLFIGIIGVVLVQRADKCSDTSPKFFEAVQLYTYFSTAFAVVCVINSFSTSLFLYLMRSGRLLTKDAAPDAIELCRIVNFKAPRSAEDDELLKADNDEAPTCPICIDEFDENKEIRVTPCRHVFHADCLKGWLKVSHCCPMCRKDFLVDEGGGAPALSSSDSPSPSFYCPPVNGGRRQLGTSF